MLWKVYGESWWILGDEGTGTGWSGRDNAEKRWRKGRKAVKSGRVWGSESLPSSITKSFSCRIKDQFEAYDRCQRGEQNPESGFSHLSQAEREQQQQIVKPGTEASGYSYRRRDRYIQFQCFRLICEYTAASARGRHIIILRESP